MDISTLLTRFRQCGAVSTDTRRIVPGTLFFALHGARFDGNAYAAEALEKGAAYAVIDDPARVVSGDARYLLVDDTLKALQALASAYRRTFSCPVIGITGSNGKTTTKELLHSVVATERRVFSTRGNFNNHIGVPLTLLSWPQDLEIAVVEMGANKPGDIAELAEIAEPTHGLITNVGAAHLEQLGSLEGVAETKGGLFRDVIARGGLLFVNQADPRVVGQVGAYAKRRTFGTPDADFSYQLLDHQWGGMKLAITCREWPEPLEVQSQLSGDYNAMNLLAAVAVAAELGITQAGIREGLYRYVPANNRSQLVQHGPYQVWMDAYNANPSSMKASVANAFGLRQDRVALILGDMLELGDEAEAIHAEMGRFVSGLKPQMTVCIGPLMQHALPEIEGPKAGFPDVESAAPEIAQLLQGAELVLLKGSRGMALERLMAHF